MAVRLQVNITAILQTYRLSVQRGNSKRSGTASVKVAGVGQLQLHPKGEGCRGEGMPLSPCRGGGFKRGCAMRPFYIGVGYALCPSCICEVACNLDVNAARLLAAFTLDKRGAHAV